MSARATARWLGALLLALGLVCLTVPLVARPGGAQTYRGRSSSGRRGAPKVDEQRPSCGAPLDIEMTGNCRHCGVKVTSGDFDWVLSRIEQDDSY